MNGMSAQQFPFQLVGCVVYLNDSVHARENAPLPLPITLIQLELDLHSDEGRRDA